MQGEIADDLAAAFTSAYARLTAANERAVGVRSSTKAVGLQTISLWTTHAIAYRLPQKINLTARKRHMTINQGDVYWIQGTDADESELGVHPHPYVVLQEDVFNHSRIDTLVVCALTTNMKQANLYGNVLLDTGEANLPNRSVVVVSKVSAVKKAQLGDYIGSLSSERVHQILAGMRFVQASFFSR